MNAIGGYFGLELRGGNEYHLGALRLNTGRNALEYILTQRKYKKIFLPYFTCDVLLQPILKLKIQYEFYSIDENFEPIFDVGSISIDDAFLYTNYFGLKDTFVNELKDICPNLIIDNAQAFYAKAHEGVDTFYSVRKFFGLPDGAYLYTDCEKIPILEQHKSFGAFEHLLRRLDNSAEDGYLSFVSNDKLLGNLPILKMSNITLRLLKNIDYDIVAKKRITNFTFLLQELGPLNKIKFSLLEGQVPMTFPFYSGDEKLRNNLLKRGVYTAQYWPNVFKWVGPHSTEYKYTQNIINLPIDQRYSLAQMKTICKIIRP
jgi:hypothetical protein